MKASEVREKYLKFFEARGHSRIPSAPVVPENDPSVLFTTAGMHPLVPFLLGEIHPNGKRLVNVQKCLRTDDIDEVGDYCHHTFFEMLGNWSLGDYFKKEAIEWSLEFLTSPEYLGLDKDKLAFSVFVGDEDAPFDQESYDKWLSLGIPRERIAKLPKKNNWWGPAGETGPCGPDTEMFYWTGTEPVPVAFDPDDSHWVEIWNDVFMQYNKTSEGTFELLKQKNVDTGMGLERTLAVVNKLSDNYKTELFLPVIEKLEELTKLKYEENVKAFRIIADHIRASVFLIADGVEPSNKERGYILRRLIRRSIVQMKRLNILSLEQTTKEIAEIYISMMSATYPELLQNKIKIHAVLETEVVRFIKTLDKGLKEFNKLDSISGNDAFNLFQTYGFPVEITVELAAEKGQKVDTEAFIKEFEKHKELSRTASSGMFKGGLADQSEQTTKYHTATHLLHKALRKVLGDHVVQKGSNITAERLRFDFSHPQKLTDEEVKKVEDLINEQIQKDLPVTYETKTYKEATDEGALAFFGERYGEKVKVYTIGDPKGEWFSKEVCGGPHVDSTGSIGHVTITKQEKVGSGLMRIYAQVR